MRVAAQDVFSVPLALPCQLNAGDIDRHGKSRWLRRRAWYPHQRLASRRLPLVVLAFFWRFQGDPQDLRYFFLNINDQFRMVETLGKTGIFFTQPLVF